MDESNYTEPFNPQETEGVEECVNHYPVEKVVSYCFSCDIVEFDGRQFIPTSNSPKQHYFSAPDEDKSSRFCKCGKYLTDDVHFRVNKEVNEPKEFQLSRTTAPEGVEREIGNCPYCPNQGWYAERDRNGDPERVQCRWCYEEPYSKFNIESLNTRILSLEAQIQQVRNDTLEEAAKIAETVCLKVANWRQCYVGCHNNIAGAIRSLAHPTDKP